MKILNKKAKFDYEIFENFEFGVVLLSSEIKAIREGVCNLQDAYLDYCFPHLYIYNMFIGEYKNLKHETRRDRIILLKKKERNKLLAKVQKKGYSVIPLELFFNKRGFAKLKCGLGVGKKLYDKRKSIKERDLRRFE